MSNIERADMPTPPDQETIRVVSRYRKYRPYVFALVVVMLVHLGYEFYLQRRINRLTDALAGENWEAAQENLINLETRALPYTARAFYYSDDPAARRRAGETLLKSLENLVQDAPKPSPEALEAWNAWKAEADIGEDALLAEIVREAEGSTDSQVQQILPEMKPWLYWQEDIRNAVENEMITKALADEDPECRKLAAQMVQITGFEHGIERGRYRRYQNMVRLLAKLREDPASEENRQAVLEEWRDPETVGEFGNPVLVGLVDTGETKEVKEAAAFILRDMLASAYRADDRDEMVRLVGHRRLRILLRLLTEEEAEYIDIKGLLTFSPNIPERFVEGLRLQFAEAETEQELRERIDYWKDIYTSIEEGQRAVLRSDRVQAIMPPAS